MIKQLLTYFMVFLFIAFNSHAADDKPIPEPAKPQNGVFFLANGYQVTILELKDGNFRYWFASDVVPAKKPNYPFTGKYSLQGDRVILKHDQISTHYQQWIFRTLKGVVTLWTPEAIDYYNRERDFNPYGILRITEKPAEQVWADPNPFFKQ